MYTIGEPQSPMKGGLGMSRIAIAMGLMGTLLLGCGQGQTSGRTQTTTLGQDFEQDSLADLPVGTTQVEVLREFGAPGKTKVDEDGSEVWTYVHTNAILPVGTAHSEGEEADIDQRVTQAPSLTTLDHQEATIKMGLPVTWRTFLRFRDGKLVEVDDISSSLVRVEQSATVDQNGNVTITYRDEEGEAGQERDE